MSFKCQARKVRNRDLGLWVRLAALRSCIARVAFMENFPYTEIFERLDRQFGFNRCWEIHPEQVPSEESLLNTLAALEQERNEVIAHLEEFARYRLSEKRNGNRQMSAKDKGRMRSILTSINDEKPASP